MSKSKTNIAYKTKFGKCYLSEIEKSLELKEFQRLKGKINLIFTSPPFPLNRKKKYGNKDGEEYINWLTQIVTELKEYLTQDGSIVIEIGNAWNEKNPTMSILPLKTLLSFIEISELKLCQQFVWFNNAKLPSPAQWVNIERCRVKDAFTNIWWMSKTSYPKANNKNVLVEYSDSMNKLLKRKSYNHGLRPSEHLISEKSFLKNNNGSIPSNVLIGSNTVSNSKYIDYCKKNNIELHPARMPNFIAEFFINLLTEPGDIVLDPFGGSNTTGEVAESLKRKWITVEANLQYIKGSKGRFDKIID